MPSTATTRNRLEKQAPGENSNTWGTVLNNAVFDLVDAAADGVESYTLSGNKTLTSTNYAADEARMRVQNITGGTGGTITIPAVQKNYIIRNGSSGTVTISNGTNTLDIPAGNVEQIFTDGTNIYRTARLDLGSDLLTTTGTPTNAGHLTTKTYVDGQIAAAVFDSFGTLGAGVSDFLTTPTSSNLAAAVTDETGSGSLVFATSPTLVAPTLGTPASGTLTNCTGFPVSGLAGLGSGVATFLASPTSANLAAAVTGETGTAGGLVFSVSPAFTGTPTAPTAAPGTNTTQIATTAFVTAAVSASGGGTVSSVAISGGTTGLTTSGGPITSSGTITLGGTLAVANGGTGVTSSTGTGSVVLSASPTFTGVVSVADGTVSAPSVAFSGDPNTGIYRPSVDRVAIAAGGAQAALFKSDGFIESAGIILSSAVQTAIGTAGAPSLIFGTDTDTGLYRSATDTLNISTGGSSRVEVSSTVVTTTLPIRAANGTSSAPSYSFTNNTDAGFYWNSSNSTVDFVIDGDTVARLNGTGSGLFQVVNSLQIESGGSFNLLGTNAVRFDGGTTPSSASDTGTAGTIRWDTNYIYVCTASNTWKRVAISTW